MKDEMSGENEFSFMYSISFECDHKEKEQMSKYLGRITNLKLLDRNGSSRKDFIIW